MDVTDKCELAMCVDPVALASHGPETSCKHHSQGNGQFSILWNTVPLTEVKGCIVYVNMFCDVRVCKY